MFHISTGNEYLHLCSESTNEQW